MQLECRGEENPLSKSRRMQTSHAGKGRVYIITRVSWTHAKGHTAPGLQGSCSLLAEGFLLTASHWSTPGDEAARSVDGTHSGNNVYHPHSPGQAHQDHLHGHGDCLSRESAPWKPVHGGHPFTSQTSLKEQGRWLPGNRLAMASLADKL